MAIPSNPVIGDKYSFGTLRVNGLVQANPTEPWRPDAEPITGLGVGNIPMYPRTGLGETILVGDSDGSSANQIQWVYVGNNKYISDRNILGGASWNVLNTNGYVNGMITTIDGIKVKIDLLSGGTKDRSSGTTGYAGGTPTDNDWDQFIQNEAGISGMPTPPMESKNSSFKAADFTTVHNNLWNWAGQYSWCKETSGGNSSERVIRGYESASYLINNRAAGDRDERFGFRPVLEVLNTAPSLPGTITLPSTINSGKSFSVSWGASSDEQGDTVSYKLERQLNNGTWTQIYQAAGRSTSDTVPFGTSTVRYRVKAYDTAGLESAYQTSATKTVVNNTAPTTPGTPNVPATVIGGNSITITWGASSDAQNNAIKYYLQRSVTGGTNWSNVYNGSALSFADTIPKGTPSVTYRVRAYDGTDYSSYAVSETRTVDNTVPPEITADDAVTVADGFSWNYTVTQPDGEETTVTEAIDGKTHRTYTATLDEQNTFSVTGRDFMTLLNGSHTLSVTATSSGGKSVSRSAAVTKAVHEASVTLTNPLPADALITRMVMSVTGYIPPDAEYQVLATNNANDDSPVWEDVTAAVRGAKKYFFTNTTAENGSAFNFRLTARRGNTGGYISLIGGAFE